MHDAIPQESFLPRGALVAAGLLVGVSLAGVTVARLMHYNATPLPAARAVQARHLAFRDRTDGGVDVLDDDQGGALVYSVAPNTGGFVRGVLRSLARARRAGGVGPLPPLTFTRWSDGRFTLDDPETRQHLNLEVFGATNSRPFAEIFTAVAPLAPAATDQIQGTTP
jgi:putative photosynthetic complex assembly protein